eukprot:gene4435-14570_t
MTTWFKVYSEAPGSKLYIGVGVGDMDGLTDVLMNAIVFGPGFNGTSEVKGPPGMGALQVSGTNDTSTCDFLESSTSIRAYQIHEGRCAYYEPWGRNWLYSLLDRNITLPEEGDYYVAIQPKRAAHARFFIAPSDWAQSEEFRTPYSSTRGEYRGRYNDNNAGIECCTLDGMVLRGMDKSTNFDDCAELPM